jgi:hypothetical protein
MGLGLGGTLEGVSGCLHLFEPMHDGRVEFVFVGEMALKVAAGCEHFRAERATVASRKLTEEVMEVEVAERSGDVLAMLTVEEGKVAFVHSNVVGCSG